MSRSLLICMIFCGLSACSGTETVYVVPVVPEALRRPVEVAPRSGDSLADVGLVITDLTEALATANDRILSTDCILTAAENGVPDVCKLP